MDKLYSCAKCKEGLPLFLTAEQAARLLGIPVRTVYEKIRQKKMPISPHGRPYRVDRDALFQMTKGGCDRGSTRAQEVIRPGTNR